MKATQRKRARRMSQMERFWLTPTRIDRSSHRRPANGWAGGRDRDKPRKMCFTYRRHGVWIGGVIQYEPCGRWYAYEAKQSLAPREEPFWHRRDAKRWVEALQ